MQLLTELERLKMIQWLQHELYGNPNAEKTLRNNSRSSDPRDRKPGKKTSG